MSKTNAEYIYNDSAYINLNSVYLFNIGADRQTAIETIRDLRYGNSFIHNKRAYYETEKTIALTDEELKKLFVSMNYMNRVIKEIVTFSPILNDKMLRTRSKNFKKINRMKKFLEINKWELLQPEIIDGIEEGGDVFIEIYFVKSDPIPRLRLLDSSKIKDIVTDKYGNVKAYIYKDQVVDKDYDNFGDIDRTMSREMTWIFERGRTIIVDPLRYEFDEEGMVIKDEDGNKVIKPEIKLNKIDFRDDFLLIHIPGFRRQGQVFSDIPASAYVDYCLWADAIATDYRYTNKLAGFPISIIMNGELQAKSSRSPGGFIFINDISEDAKADFKSIEIKNDLETFDREWSRVENALSEAADLMRPENKTRASGSDSSRVYAQGNIPLELKLKKYLTNINDAMTKVFNIVQKSYGYKTIDEFWFELPNPIITLTVFDEQLKEMNDLAMGIKTIRDLLRERGYNQVEIDEKLKELNEEFYAKGKDITVAKEVSNRVSNGTNAINSGEAIQDKRFL